MSRKTLFVFLMVLVLVLVVAAPAFAANPGTTGQPSQSCQAEPSSPAGFLTSAFLNIATAVYAGSPGTPSLANGNAAAVSQYDVACFQVSQH